MVTRVPNKSVEDLFCSDVSPKAKASGDQSHYSSASSHSELSPGAERLTTSSEGGTPSSASLSPDAMPSVWSDERQMGNALGEGSMFGIIKDLSVFNIHACENDKTSDFLRKDFNSIFQDNWQQNTCTSNEGSFEIEIDSSACEEKEDFTLSPCRFLSTVSSSLPSAHCNFESDVISASTTDLPQQDRAFSHTSSQGSSPSRQMRQVLVGFRTNDKRNSCQSKNRSPIEAEVDSSIREQSRLDAASMADSQIQSIESDSAISSFTPAGLDDKAKGNCNNSDDHVSLVEMAESLLHMTAQMHSHMKCLHGNSTAEEDSTVGLSNVVPSDTSGATITSWCSESQLQQSHGAEESLNTLTASSSAPVCLGKENSGVVQVLEVSSGPLEVVDAADVTEEGQENVSRKRERLSFFV